MEIKYNEKLGVTILNSADGRAYSLMRSGMLLITPLVYRFTDRGRKILVNNNEFRDLTGIEKVLYVNLIKYLEYRASEGAIFLSKSEK